MEDGFSVIKRRVVGVLLCAARIGGYPHIEGDIRLRRTGFRGGGLGVQGDGTRVLINRYIGLVPAQGYRNIVVIGDLDSGYSWTALQMKQGGTVVLERYREILLDFVGRVIFDVHHDLLCGAIPAFAIDGCPAELGAGEGQGLIDLRVVVGLHRIAI